MRKILLTLLVSIVFSGCAFADTTIKIPAEFLNDVAKSFELKAGKNFIQRLLINQVIKNSSVNGVKLKDFSVENLIDYFNSDDLFKRIGTNKIVEPNTGATLEFDSDGICKGNSCTITVDLNGDKGPNEIWTNSSEPKDRLVFVIRQDSDKGLSIIVPDFKD